MLRELEEKDAPFMLEWMHDATINCNFQYPFGDMTLEKVKKFIENCNDEGNKHFAIVDEKDEYLGTISLKNISQTNKNAEYAVVTRKKAQGTGVAKAATKEIIRYAFEELDLHKVYLNVLQDNERAIRFYEKCGFVEEGISRDAIRIKDDYKNLIWYGIVSGRENGTRVRGVKEENNDSTREKTYELD